MAGTTTVSASICGITLADIGISRLKKLFLALADKPFKLVVRQIGECWYAK